MKELWSKISPILKSHPRGWRWTVYILGGLVLFIILMDGVVMPVWTRQAADTTVPNIMGLDFQKAADSLGRCDLRIEKVGEKFDPNYPEGTVIFQLPDADSRVKKDRLVKVTLSKGGETVIVPSRAGLSLERAELTLGEWGLRLGDINYAQIDTLPALAVVGSFPQAGSKVPAGMVINLVVNQASAEADSATVPNVIGKNLAEGSRILEKSGLKIDKVKRREDNALLPETILAQSLQPGEKVPIGTEIDLIISILEE